MLDDIFLRNAVFHLADIVHGSLDLSVGSDRENPDALALTFAAGFNDPLSQLASQLFEHGGADVLHPYALSAVKLGKDLGKDIFVHENADVAPVGKGFAELRPGPQGGDGTLLLFGELIIAGPLILVQRDVVYALGAYDIPENHPGIQTGFLGKLL